MKKIFCPVCNEYRTVRIEPKKEIFLVRKDNIEVLTSVLLCNTCNQSILDEELDGKNLELAYNEYRKKHNLLFPDEIKEIREKYGLSQRALGRLLGWGEITINRYESGAIQDSSHNEMLKLIQDPKNMLKICENRKTKLPAKIIDFIKETIKESYNKKEKELARLEDFLMNNRIDEFSGFKKFDIEKIKNMILSITEKLGGVFPTKLNKLLWYMDFLHFKEFSVSISGSNYIHLPYGPIPDNYEIIIAIMMSERFVGKEEVNFGNDVSGEKIKNLVNFEKNSFTVSELKTIDFVIDYFGKYSSKEISALSHKEKAYIKTAENEKISYNYSLDLTLSLN